MIDLHVWLTVRACDRVNLALQEGTPCPTTTATPTTTTATTTTSTTTTTTTTTPDAVLTSAKQRLDGMLIDAASLRTRLATIKGSSAKLDQSLRAVLQRLGTVCGDAASDPVFMSEPEGGEGGEGGTRRGDVDGEGSVDMHTDPATGRADLVLRPPRGGSVVVGGQ